MYPTCSPGSPCGLARTLLVAAVPAALAGVALAALLQLFGTGITTDAALFPSSQPDVLEQVLQAVVVAIPLVLAIRPLSRLGVPAWLWGALYGVLLWGVGLALEPGELEGAAVLARGLALVTYGGVLGMALAWQLGLPWAVGARRPRLLPQPFPVPRMESSPGDGALDDRDPARETSSRVR